MKTAARLLVATLLLATVAFAGDKSKGAFLENATQGSYFFSGDNVYGGIYAQVGTDETGAQVAYLNVYIYDHVNNKSLYASGNVDPSTFSVTGNTLSMSIADLYGLPDFDVDATNFANVIPLNCAMTATDAWVNEQTGKYTKRVVNEDGTVTLQKRMEKSTGTSAMAVGNLETYVFPSTDWDDEEAGLYKGSFKTHLVP